MAWLNMNNLFGENPSDHLRDVGKIALNNGAWFGKDGSGFVRLNFGCPREILVEGLRRIENTINQKK